MGNVRLGEFASVVGMHRDAVVSMLKTKRAPFPLAEIDGQRTYSGAEVLAMALHCRLDPSRSKCSADKIIASGVVETAMRNIENGHGLGDLSLCVPDPALTESQIRLPTRAFAAPLPEVCNFLRWQAGDDVPDPQIYGMPTPRTGLHSATIVLVAEAYRAAQKAAEEVGFRMIGRALLPI